jgi:hypothetical protein
VIDEFAHKFAHKLALGYLPAHPSCPDVYSDWIDAAQLDVHIMADGRHVEGTMSSRSLRGLKHSSPTVLATRAHPSSGLKLCMFCKQVKWTMKMCRQKDMEEFELG